MGILIKLKDEVKQKAIETILTKVLVKKLKEYNPDAKVDVTLDNFTLTDSEDGTTIKFNGELTIDNTTIVNIILGLI